MKIRLHDGTVTDASIARWDGGRWLVVLPGIGSTILSTEELTDRMVEE